MSKSKNYHDYVIKNGDFVGKFEEMYQNSSDTPWHQDEAAYEINAKRVVGNYSKDKYLRFFGRKR